MTLPSPLMQRLDILRGASPEWRRRYDQFIARLRTLPVGVTAPRAGDRFPDVALPDHRGRYRSLESLYCEGPLVLSFNRGSWCPYCVSEIDSWRQALPSLQAAGGRLAVVTAETQGRSQVLADIAGPGVIALCDLDFGLALELGLAFYVGQSLLTAYRDFGLDLEELYGGGAGILPVPATFVIRPDGIVAYAFVEADFRLRAEPEDVVRVVAAIASRSIDVPGAST